MSHINGLFIQDSDSVPSLTRKGVENSLVFAAIERLKAAPPDDILAGGSLLTDFVRRHLYAILVRWGRPLPTLAATDAVLTVQLLVLWGLKLSYVIGRGMSPSTFVWRLGRWRLDQYIKRNRPGCDEQVTSLMASQLADRSAPVDSRLERADEAAKLRGLIDRLRPVFTGREWEALEAMLAGHPVGKGVAYRVRLKLKKHLIPWC